MSEGPYRNDLHRLMSQPESWFTGHTPNWPKDKRCTLVRISVKIADEGRGLSCEAAPITIARMETRNPHLIDHDTIEANAQFICTAVNCHEELIDALKSCQSNMRVLAKAYGQFIPGSPFADADNAATKVLIKARGEK